jgi:hypothetical protein
MFCYLKYYRAGVHVHLSRLPHGMLHVKPTCTGTTCTGNLNRHPQNSF